MFGLIVSHMQKKAACNIKQFPKICANINMLIDFQRFKYPKVMNPRQINVFVSELIPSKLGSTVKEINTTDCIVFPTKFYNSNYYKYQGIDSILKQENIRNVVITGIETQWCIMQTSRYMLEQGFKVHIPIDAVGTYDMIEHQVALDRLKSYGAKLCTTRGYISEHLISTDDNIARWYLDNITQKL